MITKETNTKLVPVILLSLVSLLSNDNRALAESQLKGRLNINTATVAELCLLPTIGPAKAKMIIALRQRIKGFKRLDDLLKVKGIGKGQFARIEPLIKLEGGSDIVKE